MFPTPDLEKCRINAHVLYKAHFGLYQSKKTKNNFMTLMKFLAFSCVGSVTLFIFKHEETEISAINLQKKFEASKLKAGTQ